jgi:drug/metabolite transporter (DMT)-like permease
LKPLIVALGIATLGSVIYHVGQKSVAPTSNPMVVLMGAYGVAFLIAAVAMPFFRTPGTTPWTVQLFSPAVAVLGVGVLLIEVGFLVAYRSGGSLQWSGVAVNGLATLVLLPIAVSIFHEPFSLARAAGVLCVLGGLVLLTRP